MSYTKIVLADDLLDSDLADDPFLRSELFSYFPAKMRQGYRGQMEQHQLRREIVVTQMVNQLVNNAGMTYFHRLAGETSATTAELTRANFVAREIFGAGRLQSQIASFDNQLDADVQTHMRLEMRTLVERASRWLLNSRRCRRGRRAVVDEFEVVVEKVTAELPTLMTGRELAAFEAPPRQAARPRRAGGPRGPGRGLPAGVHDPRYGRDRRPRRPRPDGGRPGALRGRRAARPPAAGRPHPARCRATTGGRRWPGRRCATTCTPCTPS